MEHLMKKTFRHSSLITSILLAGLITSAGFAEPGQKPAQPVLEPLTQAEKDGLLRMRLEEKLAHDLCEELARSSSLPLFRGMRDVSAQRMKQIDKQLEKYSAYEPIAEDRQGRFEDDARYKRYRKILQLGKLSRLNALREFAGVKEMQILDYGNTIAVTTKPDLDKLLTNFLKQSQDQLRRTYKRIGKEGATYEPQFMDRDTFFELMQGI